MKIEYNDCQIMSPLAMEKIAREYNQKLKNMQDCKTILAQPNPQTAPQTTNLTSQDHKSMQEYVNILNNIKVIYNNLNILKNYCSKKYYSKK